MSTVAISASRTSARIWRQSGLAVPPPEARIWVGRGHPGGEHQVEAVAQPEGDALQDGPGQVAPVVAEGQADERAAGQRVRVRAALARQVRQEEQAVAAGRDLGGRRGEVAELRRRAPARRGTSAGCRPPTASPTSCASAPGPRGRRRGRRPAARGAAGRSPRRRRRTSRARAPSCPARRPRPRPRWPPGRRRRPRPGCRHGARWRRRPPRVTVPVTSGPSKVGGSQAGSIPRAARTSGDQSRAARSNRSVPAPSALSRACSPVSRRRR